MHMLAMRFGPFEATDFTSADQRLVATYEVIAIPLSAEATFEPDQFSKGSSNGPHTTTSRDRTSGHDRRLGAGFMVMAVSAARREAPTCSA